VLTREGFGLFNHKLDYINTFNLLSLFNTNDAGEPYFDEATRKYPEAHVHFQAVFNNVEMMDIIDNYHALKEYMINELIYQWKIISDDIIDELSEPEILEMLFAEPSSF
jgi:hypothetical protein